MEPPSGDLDTTLGEAAEVPIPDRLPIMEPASGVIEMETVEALECLEDTNLKVANEGAEAAPVSLSASSPHQGGIEKFQGMPRLEDAKPEEVLREEPLVATPPADAVMDLEGMPELEDGGPEESIEENSADIPPIRKPLAQP